MTMQLNAKKRELLGRKAKKLIREGFFPGVVYGHGIENTNISLNENEFKKIYQAAGESTLIDLKIENQEPVKAIIKETQKNLAGENFIHVDLHQVKMDEKLTTDIALKFINEAPAVKLGGTLIANIDSVSVECLPKDLVHEIEVDLSSLDDFEKNILIKDIEAPAGIKILNEDTEAVATVEAPRKAEEVKPAEETPVAGGEAKKEEEKKEEGK
ncbi:hypothetical protein A2Y83_03960 [Candidatus Falkowbacteria bacterium RBG_13_39_14]|uniref:Large ribosomal subunit protein bL25 n=1 Tax=Candidatus Falkowbacteria bacterium RBG_13_39_14 TaxID=1797985 RepID=A0A1F5S7V0_9BACT|nr:MAG: hypothetical protein A2Y83_03960 [Candidatus Falkowbacteria bacterium RBG_13_39_14]